MDTDIKAAESIQVVASIDDLLTEILLRLPMKSLIRCKSVSRRWHSLITDPRFRHRRNPASNPAVGMFLASPGHRRFEYVPFSGQGHTNPPFRTLDFTADPRGIRALQSCNGLWLCCSAKARLSNRSYYVYNPTTKDFSTLPKLEKGNGIANKIYGMRLAFDPAKSPYYKAICIRGSESETGQNRLQIEIFSSETGPWRLCGEPSQPKHASTTESTGTAQFSGSIMRLGIPYISMLRMRY